MSENGSSYWEDASVIHITDTQWGDNGKGKITDDAAQGADIVVRTNGGANAGHTVENDHGEFKLHLVPCGIFNPNTVSIIGPNVVVDPIQFYKEYSDITAQGVEIGDCLLSQDAHLVMPWHRVRDNLRETSSGEVRVGTTGQGIGEVYSDRARRVGFRVRDMYEDNFEENFCRTYDAQARLIQALANGSKVPHMPSAEEILTQLHDAREFIEPRVSNTMEVIGEAHEAGKKILGEAGQGVLLDLDFGGYPFVTSSHPGAMGFLQSTGLHPRHIDKVIGVTKSYMTRVGEGPMVTELSDESGYLLQQRGNEFGVTTGRTRRTGWFDIPATRYGARVSGSDELALTKLDVLDAFPEIKVCIGYKVGNQEISTLYDFDPKLLSRAEPIYHTLPGWESDTTGITNYDKLPKQAKDYVSFIQNELGVTISKVSVGPHRNQTIHR